MSSHLWWLAALFVSVQTGVLYSDLCDEAYANGDNGPFGYGAHQGRSDLIEAFLLLGLLYAVTLTIIFHKRRHRGLTVKNFLIGAVGGTVAALDASNQSESNPYCTDAGVLPTAAIALVILTMAVRANTGLPRMHRRK